MDVGELSITKVCSVNAILLIDAMNPLRRYLILP